MKPLGNETIRPVMTEAQREELHNVISGTHVLSVPTPERIAELHRLLAAFREDDQ